jgi:hypothetical protein
VRRDYLFRHDNYLLSAAGDELRNAVEAALHQLPFVALSAVQPIWDYPLTGGPGALMCAAGDRHEAAGSVGMNHARKNRVQ